MSNERELLFQQTSHKNEVLEHVLRGWDFCILKDLRNYIAVFPGKKEVITYEAGEITKTENPADLAGAVLPLLGEYDQFRTMKPADA